MASKLITLAEIIFSRRAISRTSTAPNSWATIALWRRYFEGKKLEEENEIEEIGQILETEVFEESKYRPVAHPDAKNELREFSKQYYRDIIAPVDVFGIQRGHQSRPSAGQVQDVLNRPNLSVPVEGEFLYRAQ